MKRYEKRDRASSVEESSPCLGIAKVSNLAARETDSWFITRLLRVPGTWCAFIRGRYIRRGRMRKRKETREETTKGEAGSRGGKRMRGDLASLSYVRTYTQATIARLHLPAADLASFFPWCLRCFFAVAARSFSNIATHTTSPRATRLFSPAACPLRTIICPRGSHICFPLFNCRAPRSPRSDSSRSRPLAGGHAVALTSRDSRGQARVQGRTSPLAAPGSV